VLSLITLTGLCFISATVLNDGTSVPSKLVNIGTIIGISTLFVYNLIKERNNG
jgi:hypothetical protein